MSEIKKEKNAFQRLSRKISDALRKIFFYIFFNPIVMVSLGFFVGARVYEGGLMGIQGTTVWVSGVCETRDGLLRDDLAQDQVIVSAVSENTIEGMIRKTRENIICNLSQATIDRLGPLDQIMQPKIAIPEIAKLEAKPVVGNNYEQFKNKKLKVSGICRTDINERLPPFRDMIVDVTNVTDSKIDSSTVYFTGIREDNVPVVCSVKDITYSLVLNLDSEIVDEKTPTNVGKKVFVTGLCFPDMLVYDKIGKQPSIPYYDMQKVPVEVTEDRYSREKNKIIVLRGSILDQQTTYKGEKIFGHKIVCDDKDSPLNVSLESDDLKIEIEKK